jgi:DNA-directed RNA polymerase subunit RPC12/RpoP
MTTNFLHKDEHVPPDEAYERDAPDCPNCGQQMWLMRVNTQLSDHGTRSKRQYECIHCGAKTSQHTTSDLITPLS